MDTQINPIPIEELCSDWKRLKSALYELGDIQLEFFLKTYVRTEELLRECLGVEAIDRKYIPLIIDASAFANASLNDPSALVQAAKVLVERTLYQYLINEDVNPAKANRVMIYSLELQQHLTLDFLNPEKAIEDVAKAFGRK